MAAIVQHNGQTELIDMTREDVEVQEKFIECYCYKLRQSGAKARHHCAVRIWQQRFHFENESNVFRLHYAGGIWKRRSASVWKHIKCFPPSLRQKNFKTQQSRDCLHRFRKVSVHTKTRSRRFQNIPVWRAFSKSRLFLTVWCGR